MLYNFTWWQFCGTFLLLCAFYYPLILLLYYKPSIERFSQRFTADHSIGTQPTTDDDIVTTETNKTIPQFTSVIESGKLYTSLEEAVRIGIKAAKDANADKAQVLGLLKNILLKYPELKQSGEQVKVNELLVQECSQAGYILHMAEAFALWPATPQQQS